MGRLSIFGIPCLLFVLLVCSCNSKSDSSNIPEDVTTYFHQTKCGDSPDFAIYQQQITDPSKWDHVITVHGYFDDANVAHGLVEHLNESGFKAYKAVQLNH